MTGGELSLEPVVAWVAALSLLLSFGTAVWTLLTSGARKNDTRLATLTARVDENAREYGSRVEQVERRMQRIQDQVGTLPDMKTIHRMELTMTRVEGQVGVLDERLRPVAAVVERMQELMLQQSKGH